MKVVGFLLNLFELNPRVNVANRVASLPNQIWGPRVIPDSQIIYVISGRATLKMEGKLIQLESGQCAFYGSDTPHQLVASDSDPATFASIHFDWNCTSTIPQHPVPRIQDCAYDQLSRPAKSYRVRFENDEETQFPHHFPIREMEPVFMRIIDEFSKQEPGYTSILSGLLLQLLTGVLRSQLQPPDFHDTYQKIAPAIHAIRKDIQKNWKIHELAKICGYHPTYLTEMFRTAMRCSPKHFMMLERIAVAKTMLLEGDAVAFVAQQLGYNSVHYFCRTFKNFTGMTPTEFRRRHTAL